MARSRITMSPATIIDGIMWPAMFVFAGVFVILIVVGAITTDGIWTDPDTGCRYKVGGGENVTYSPLLLPSGLPDCRAVEVKP